MIISMQDLLSDDQALTLGSAVASTNYIDRGARGTPPAMGVIAPVSIYNDLGVGRPLPIQVMVTVAFADLAGNLVVALQVDNDSAFGSATTVATITVAAAKLVAGYKLPMMYVPEGTNERYVRLLYTPDDACTGSISAFVGTEHAGGGLEPAAFSRS